MKPHPPSHTPQHRSTTRCKGRKSIESYLKSKYPDSTFYNLKFAKSSDEENGVGSKPVAGKSEHVKKNVRKHRSPMVKHIRCSCPVTNERGDSKVSKPPHPTMVRQSDVGVGLKDRRGRPKKNHPEPQSVCYSSSPVTAISKSVQGEGRTDSKLNSSVVKLSQCSSLMKTGGGPSKNPPMHSTKVRKSGGGVGLKNRRPEPQNVCYISSPVTDVSESLQAKGCTGGQKNSSVMKIKRCTLPVENNPTVGRLSDVGIGLKHVRDRLKKNEPGPQNVFDFSSSVTALSKNVQAEDLTDGKQRFPVVKLSRCSSLLENRGGDLTNREPTHSTKARQSGLSVCLKNKQGRLKNDNPLPQNVIDSRSPNVVNTGTHGSTSKTPVNGIPPVGKPQNVNNDDRPVVDTLKTTASSPEVMYMGDHRTNSEKLVYKKLPVVKLKRLNDELNYGLKQYGFVSASWLEMVTKHSGGQKLPFAGKYQHRDTPSKSVKSSAASENFKYSLSNDTKNRTQDQVCENSGNKNETDSNKCLGVDSLEKTPSFIKYLTKHNYIVASHSGSRSRGNRRSNDKKSKDTKHSGCESTEDILTNGAKRLEVRLHDLRLGEQCLKRKTIEDRPSKLKKTPVRQSPGKYSESHSSIQPAKICANPRILRRSEHPAKKSKIQLNAAKSIGKVDDVVEVLDSNNEQNSNAIPMVMQPIVVQQIFMQQIVMLPSQPVVMLPSQGLQLVSEHEVPEFPHHGKRGVGSVNQYDDTISVISSAESLDSGDSENEIMVQSLINADSDYSELHDVCYISEQTERQAHPNIELEDFCYISEETKLHAFSNGGNSTKQLESSSEKQRPSLPDAAIVNTSCGGELPSDFNDGPSNQEESVTKKETSLSFCSGERGLLNGASKGPLSPAPPNEAESSEKEQNQPRTLDGFVEESSESCTIMPVSRVLTSQEDSFTPNNSRPNSSTELVENMGTFDMELLIPMPSNEDNGAREQAKLLNNSGKSVSHHPCSELPHDLNDLADQKGVITSKEEPSGLPTNPVEMEALEERSTSCITNEGVNEGQIRPSTYEATVCKPSFVGASCEIDSDISDAIFQGKISSPHENLTVLKGAEEAQTLPSTPEVSDQKPSLVEESGESCCDSRSDQNDLTNQENGFSPIQTQSVAPTAPIEDMEALEGTCRSSLCKISLNESAEEIQIQSSKQELLVDKSPYSDEGKESCSKLAHSDRTSRSEASDIDEDLLDSPVCEIYSTGGTMEDEIQSRSLRLSVNKLNFDVESRESTCEWSLDDTKLASEEKGFSLVENRSATLADSVEDVETLVTNQKERLPTSASRLSYRQGLLDDKNSEVSSKLSPDHNDMSNQKIVFSPITNQPISPVQSVENMEALVGTKVEFASELPVEQPSLDEEGREPFSESPLIHSDVTNLEKGFNPVLNQSVSPAENLNAFSAVESVENMEAQKGAKKDELMPCAPESSVEEPLLDEQSTKSCSRFSLIHDDVTNKENGFTPAVYQSVSPVEYIYNNMEALEGAKNYQFQPCTSELSVVEPSLGEESMESCSRSLLIHNVLNSKENDFYPVLNQPISPAESTTNLNTFEGTCRSFSDKISLGEGAKELQSQPSVFSDNSQESFSISSTDANNSTNGDEEDESENWPVSPLKSVENVEKHGEVGGCSVSEMSPSESLNNSLNHDTMEEEIPPSTHELFGGKYPLDEKSRDYGSKSSLNCSESTTLDESFVEVESQTVTPSESVGNVDAVGGVVCQITLNEGNTTKSEYWHALERSRSSTPDVSNVTKLLDKVNLNINFTKPLLPSYLDETIQVARAIPEITFPTTPAESIEKQPSSETGEGLFSQTTTNRYTPTKDCCLPPEQSKPSSSPNEVCRVSSRQAPAGDESAVEEHFTLKNGFPPSSCTSAENPPLEATDRNSECPSSFDSAYQWANVVAEKTHHCSVYVENGSSEGKNADYEQLPLDYNLPESGLTPEYVHETPSSMTQGDNGPSIKGYHSSNLVETALGDILEKSVEIDKYLSGCNNSEFRDEKKESVGTNASFSENTFFHIESLVGSNVGYEELDKKCSQETQPAGFLEMSDYTEALVDACLRENIPISSDGCLPSMHVIESADFPSVSGSNAFLGESARDSGQLAETGVIANLPVEFANECLDLHKLPTISNSVDFGDQNVSSPPSTGSHPPELIFDGFFYETDEPINLPSEGDLNTELCQYGSKSEEMQSPFIHKSQLNDDKFLNITDQKTEVDTDFLSQPLLNSSQPEDVNLSFDLTQPSSSSRIVNELSGEAACWQLTSDTSLTLIPQTEAQNRHRKGTIPEKKQPINVGSEISSKIDDLVFDEEFEQSNNVTPMKRTKVGKIMSPNPPVSVGSNPSELLFDEEFESNNNSTPVKNIRVGPSVTISRVRSRTSFELLFDEEFERSNNVSPDNKRMDGKRHLRSVSPQEMRVTPFGLVNELLIDENDEPPLNAVLESVNDIKERRNTSVGCLVISSDEESENPPVSHPGISHTNSARPINRPAVCLPNNAKTSLHNHQISEKSKREPIATSPPRMVGKSKGRNAPQKRMSKKACQIDLSDTESGNEFADSPPRKISKLSVSDEETLDIQNLKELASSRNRLKGSRDDGNHCNQSSSEKYWTHCAPIEPDEVSPIDLGDSDSEIEAESRKSLPCAPEKSNLAASIRSIEVTRNSRDVIELTDSDTESAPERMIGNPYDLVQYSGHELPTYYLDEFIESDDSFKAEKNDEVRPPSSPKPSSTKPLLSIQRQDFIKNYSQQLVELAETIYRKKKSSALKMSPSKSQPTHNSALVVSDSEHSSDSVSVGDFIQSDDVLCSGEEDATTSPRVVHSLLRQPLTSTEKSTTTTLQNSKVSGVSAKKPKVDRPSSDRLSLNTDIFSSDEEGSANRFTSYKPLPRRSPSILTKPAVIHPKNTTSKTAAPSNLFKGSTLSSICRGIPLDDRGNYRSGSDIGNNSSRIPSSEVLPLKRVFSTHLQSLLKKPATANLTITRCVNSAEKSKPLQKDKLPSSTLQGKVNTDIDLLRGGRIGRSSLSKSPSSKPGSSRQSQNVLKKRAPTTLEAKTLSENTALKSRNVSKLVSTTLARKIDSSRQIDSDQRPSSARDLDLENGDDSGHLTTPDFLTSKLVLSRQSLNFIKSVTQNRSKTPNTAPKQSKPPGNQSHATASAKKILSERSKGCRGRRVS